VAHDVGQDGGGADQAPVMISAELPSVSRSGGGPARIGIRIEITTGMSAPPIG